MACDEIRLCGRHVQQVEATDCAFAAVAGIGVVCWGLAASGGDCRKIQRQLVAF